MDTKQLLLQLTSIRPLLIEQIKISIPESQWELHFNRVARTQVELTLEFLFAN